MEVTTAPTNLGGMVFRSCSQMNIHDNSISGFVGESGDSGGVWGSGEDGGTMTGLQFVDCIGMEVYENRVSQIAGGTGGTNGRSGSGGFKAGDGGQALGLSVVDSVEVALRGNRFTALTGGDAGTLAPHNSSPGRLGSAIAVSVLASASVSLDGNIVASLSTGKQDGAFKPPLLPTACVYVDGVAPVSIDHLACASLGTGQPEQTHGIAISAEPTAITYVLNSVFHGVPGYCLHAPDGANSVFLTAVHSNLHNCGLGQAHNATVAASCISEDPLFVDPDNGDFHLLPDSPCIDAGKPSSDYSNEPNPNGCQVNMGAYGNTAEATSKEGAQHCE